MCVLLIVSVIYIWDVVGAFHFSMRSKAVKRVNNRRTILRNRNKKKIIIFLQRDNIKYHPTKDEPIKPEPIKNEPVKQESDPTAIIKDVEYWLSFGGENAISDSDDFKLYVDQSEGDADDNTEDTNDADDDADTDMEFQALIQRASTTPLYDNSPTTILKAVILVFQYITHSNTPQKHVDNFMKLVSVLLPTGHSFPPCIVCLWYKIKLMLGVSISLPIITQQNNSIALSVGTFILNRIKTQQRVHGSFAKPLGQRGLPNNLSY